MENPLFLQVPIKYGAISGLSSFVVFLIFYHSGVFPFGNANLLLLLIPIFYMCASIKIFAREFGEGFVSFGNAFGMAIRTAMYNCSIFSSFVYAYTTFVVHDGFIAMLQKEFETNLETMKPMVTEQFLENFKQVIPFITNGTMVFGDLLMKMAFSLVAALVIAAIFYKNPPKYSEE